jgi:hypothetical protein
MTFEQQQEAGIKGELDAAYELQKRGVNAYAKRANDVRENYWLDRVQQDCQKRGITDGTVLIICGRNHRDFLAEKARKRGITIDLDEYPDDLGQRIGKLVTDL